MGVYRDDFYQLVLSMLQSAPLTPALTQHHTHASEVEKAAMVATPTHDTSTIRTDTSEREDGDSSSESSTEPEEEVSLHPLLLPHADYLTCVVR